MKSSETIVLKTLEGHPLQDAAALTAGALAEVFVHATVILSAIESQLSFQWIETHEDSGVSKTEAAATLKREIAPVEFVSAILSSADTQALKRYRSSLKTLVKSVVQSMKTAPPDRYRAFISGVMKSMASMTESFVDASFYRTFDALDEVFTLDYELDRGMKIDPESTERLYEGAGVGVQSSYTTLLLALNELAPAQGAKFIDLGSGYGRAGLVIGLLRPDMEFIGYEYVGHRVDIAQASSERAGLAEKVHFIEQDLASREFEIPKADIYYLYDPFTAETYKYVFDQLKEIGRAKKIAVVTKGWASEWFSKAVDEGGWARNAHDAGTLSIFRSLPDL